MLWGILPLDMEVPFEESQGIGAYKDPGIQHVIQPEAC